MGLGVDGLVAASHIVLILAAMLSGLRLALHPEGSMARGMLSKGMFSFGALCIGVIIIERVYYVAARLLVERGLDLWSLHPAPETLSALVFLAFHFLSLPWHLASFVSRRRAALQWLFELSGFVLLWFLLVEVMW